MLGGRVRGLHRHAGRRDLRGRRVGCSSWSSTGRSRSPPTQGLALVAAGAGSAALPGADPDGPLPRALAKLAGVLGIDPSEMLDVDLGDADAAVLEVLRPAVEAHAAGRARLLLLRPRRPDPPGRRPVAGVQRRGGLVRPGPLPPWPAASGASGSTASQALTVLDETLRAARPSRRDAVAYRAGAEDPRVVLELGPQAAGWPRRTRWSASRSWADGRLRVTLPAGAPAVVSTACSCGSGPTHACVEIDDAIRRRRDVGGRRGRGASSPATSADGRSGGGRTTRR